MNKFFLSLCALSMSLGYAAPLPPADLLAKNEVIADYVGVKDMPCRFRTSLCPDQCCHATKLAQFKVVESSDYHKAGQYGDARYGVGEMVYVDVKKDIEGQDEVITQQVKALNGGERVRLTITHYYVNKDGNRYPVRPVTSFSIEK